MNKKLVDSILQFGVLFTLFIIIFFAEEVSWYTGERGSIFFEQVVFKLRLVDFLIFFFVGIVFLRKGVIFHQGSFFVHTPINKQLLLFLMCIPLATFVGFYHGFVPSYEALGIGDWKHIITGAFFFFVVLNVLNTEEKVERIVYLFLFMVTIKAIWDLGLYFTGKSQIVVHTYRAVFVEGGTLMIMMLSSVLCLSIILFKKAKGYKSIIAGLCFLCATLSIVLSMRRNIWMGTASAFVLIFFFSPMRKRLKGAFVFLCLIIFFIIFIEFGITATGYEQFQKRFSSLNVFSKDILSRHEESRIHVEDVLNAIELVKKRPIWGYGFGTAYYVPSSIIFYRKTGKDYRVIHNALLFTWVNMGIFGIFAYLLLFISFTKYGLRKLKRSQHPISIGFFCFVVSVIFTMSFFGPPFYAFFKKSILIFFAMAAVFLVYTRESEFTNESMESNN